MSLNTRRDFPTCLFIRSLSSKLIDADGEQMETWHWLQTAIDSGYITQANGEKFKSQCDEIGRMLAGMITKSDKFCHDNHD